MVRALGMLVRVHLFGRAPGLSPLFHLLPTVLLGSSCVVVNNVAGSMSSTTHGAPVLVQAVVSIFNDLALARDGVGVFAKIAESTTSETSTPPLQMRTPLGSGSDVGAAAKPDRQGKSAAPTTYLLLFLVIMPLTFLPRRISSCILGVRCPLSSYNLGGSNVLERCPNALRLCDDTACILRPNRLVVLLILLPPLPSSRTPPPPALWGDASAEAGTQADPAAPGADSLMELRGVKSG